MEFCTLQGFKAAQDLTALASRWKGVDRACLDLTDLPPLLLTHPPSVLRFTPPTLHFAYPASQNLNCRVLLFFSCIFLHLSHVCHFNTMTVHRPVISESNRSTRHPTLLQLLYKLLTQRLCSVIEGAIFPWRSTHQFFYAALQGPITLL